jgi:predicted AlkP superfamily phosphohydrolase/phosphomutase/uncharacterized membrane protein
MAKSLKTGLRELPVSLLLGVGFCSLLGFLIGLRILNWNPDLIVNTGNIFPLILSTMYLYAVIGVIVGFFAWLAIAIYSRFSNKKYRGRAFVAPWVKSFLVVSAFLLVYLALTRQNLRSGNFDNVLLVVYYLSTFFLGMLLLRSTRPTDGSLARNRRRLTLPKFYGLLFLYVVIAIGFTLVATTPASDGDALGDPQEIAMALANVNENAKAVVIGWDGAEWSVIEDLFGRGELPNLKRLVDQGVSAPFRSLPSTRSPLVWTSLATGKVPEKHGIEDFGSLQFPRMVNNFDDYPDGLGLYRLISRLMDQADLPVTSTTRRCEAIWNILSDANRSVGMIGYWASWPAEAVNGFVISDRFTYTLFNPRTSALSLKEGQTYPPELLDEVSHFCRLPESITEAERARFMPEVGGEKAFPEGWDQNQYPEWNPLYQFELAFTASESFKDAGLYMYKNHQSDFFTLYFEAVDMVSHFFWQYYRPQEFESVAKKDVEAFGLVIPEMYRYMDEILGEFLNLIDEDTDVFVISDHGFGYDLDPDIPFRTGEHRLHGVFVASGPHFQQGVKLEEIDVLDLTPILLNIFDLPAARDMDGQVRTEAFNPEFVADRPTQLIQSYETGRRISSITRSNADIQVREQIKALGYVN